MDGIVAFMAATGGQNVGAARPAWETLLEMERCDFEASAKQQGTITLVVNLANTCERVSFVVVWELTVHFHFPKRILRLLCLEDHRKVQFEDCVAEPLQTITDIFHVRNFGLDLVDRKFM